MESEEGAQVSAPHLRLPPSPPRPWCPSPGPCGDSLPWREKQRPSELGAEQQALMQMMGCLWPILSSRLWEGAGLP